MKLKKLIKALQQFDLDAEVIIDGSNNIFIYPISNKIIHIYKE